MAKLDPEHVDHNQSPLELTSEKELSEEQEALIASARILLESPGAVASDPYYKYRATTKAEKAQRLIGSLLGRKREPITPYDDFLMTPEIETTIKTVHLKKLVGWDDGLYLKQTLVRNLGSGSVEESLEMYTRQTDADGRHQDIPWKQSLLDPIEDPSEVSRLQDELNEYARKG